MQWAAFTAAGQPACPGDSSYEGSGVRQARVSSWLHLLTLEEAASFTCEVRLVIPPIQVVDRSKRNSLKTKIFRKSWVSRDVSRNLGIAHPGLSLSRKISEVPRGGCEH